MRPVNVLAAALLAVAPLACADADASDSSASSAAPAATEVAAAIGDQELPTVLVYKTPTCGCCNGWIDHLRAAGFTVEARDVRDLMTVKVDAGVPTALSSCHTAIVDGYVVEGHVPADQVKRLVAQAPDVAGIAVAGMPIGSPGMEGPNAQPYEVHSFTRDGRTTLYAQIDPR